MKKLYIALAIVAGTFAALFATVTLASRNSSGTYTLPAGNPVTTGTTISSTWANNTLADLQTEMTDSLSRSGKGGMLAPVRSVSGSLGAPQYSFTSEPTSGIYRNAINDLRMAIGASDVEQWTTAGVTVTGTITTTSPVRAGNGSAAGPGITFASDTDNGLYRIGANDWGLAVGGAGVAEMLSTGVKLLPSNPASTTAFTNTATPKNLPKAWVSLTLNSTNSPTVNDGFNVTSVAAGANLITVTFASAFSSANYAVSIQDVWSSTTTLATVNSKSTTAMDFYIAEVTPGSPANIVAQTPNAIGARAFDVIVYGAQ
jgi:hypothetical protein